MTRLSAAIACLLLPAAVAAAEFRAVEFEREEDKYRVSSDVYLAAPPVGVYEALVDYEGYPRLTSAVKEARFLEPIENGRGVVYLRMEGCILFFCRALEVTEELTVEPITRIQVQTVPESGDLEYGLAVWTIRPEGEGTLLSYRSESVPKFWIPPVIGPIIVRAVIKSRGIRAARRLEAVAAGKPIPAELLVRQQ